MRAKRTLAAAILSAVVALDQPAGASSAARSPWMTDAEITAAFRGRTIEGIYQSGLTFTETYDTNGRLDYIEPQRRMKGRWSVVEGTFCTFYEVEPTGGCFRVRQLSENCYEFYFAASDEAEAAEGGLPVPRWTARAWINDRRSTCRSVPAV